MYVHILTSDSTTDSKRYRIRTQSFFRYTNSRIWSFSQPIMITTKASKLPATVCRSVQHTIFNSCTRYCSVSTLQLPLSTFVIPTSTVCCCTKSFVSFPVFCCFVYCVSTFPVSMSFFFFFVIIIFFYVDSAHCWTRIRIFS